MSYRLGILVGGESNQIGELQVNMSVICCLGYRNYASKQENEMFYAWSVRRQKLYLGRRWIKLYGNSKSTKLKHNRRESDQSWQVMKIILAALGAFSCIFLYAALGLYIFVLQKTTKESALQSIGTTKCNHVKCLPAFFFFRLRIQHLLSVRHNLTYLRFIAFVQNMCI